ncbi:SPX domain-containing protein [Mycena sp. CBHHK59/15]|nr:SPX domain-containing protein [Mycena sp. CBHHK59/15]
MKFTRYLEDTQTPEWKRAYIDYRLFKERIRAIRRVQAGLSFPLESYSNPQLNRTASVLSAIAQSESGENSSEPSSVHLPIEKRDLTFIPSRERVEGHSGYLSDRNQRRPSIHRTHTSQSNLTPPSPGGVAIANSRHPKVAAPQLVVRQATNPSYLSPPSPVGDTATFNSRRMKNNNIPQLLVRQWTKSSQGHYNPGDMAPPSPVAAPTSPVSRVVRSFSQLMDPLRRHPYSELSLNNLMPLLSPPELAFFSALDTELQKVNSFYIDRENAMKIRTRTLEAQLNELNAHRQLFDAIHQEASVSWSAVLSPTRILRLGCRESPRPENTSAEMDAPISRTAAFGNGSSDRKEQERLGNGRDQVQLDPKQYLTARRKLKKAVLEHYRGLEMLHNYRILNIYGFRRVLTKFERVTKIPAQRAYMAERIEKSAFSSDENLRAMMEEMQNIFAVSFVQGDRKKAMTRLRAGPQYKSHHGSTFWSGIAIGSAMAAFASGLAHSVEQRTRDAIPGWDGLLFIYGVLAIPVLFALLVGLNLLVWARSRINYVFIFELDLRTRLDHREYFQHSSGCSLLCVLAFLCTDWGAVSVSRYLAFSLACFRDHRDA